MSFSDVPPLRAAGDAPSEAAKLQAELEDLQRERRQVSVVEGGRTPRGQQSTATRDPTVHVV